MAEKKRKPKLKQRAFFIWRSKRATQLPEMRRCRHEVRRRSSKGTMQCLNRAEVWFNHPDEKGRIGSCVEHSPFTVKKLTPEQGKDRNFAGRISRYREKKAKLKDDVAACAIEWAACDYDMDDLNALRKATDKYLRHEAKGEPKR